MLKKDILHNVVLQAIKTIDYQRVSLFEQMEKALQDKNIDSLEIVVSKYQRLSLKISALKEVIFDIENSY